LDRRLITQRQKIIAALKDAGLEGITNAELSKISLRYGGHLGDLYRKGYKIQKVNLDGGIYKYILLSEPSQDKFFRSAEEEIFEAIDQKGRVTAEELKGLLDENYFHIIRKNGWYERAYFQN